MSTITYLDGSIRDSETLCNHCHGNCACPGVKFDVNARPGCGSGTCTCPASKKAAVWQVSTAFGTITTQHPELFALCPKHKIEI